MANKLISAEALLLSVLDDPGINAKHFARFKEHINHAPDAVKHGRWENIRFITTGDGRAKVGDCSSCKSIERVRNYCPNCGARMDGENDG